MAHGVDRKLMQKYGAIFITKSMPSLTIANASSTVITVIRTFICFKCNNNLLSHFPYQYLT